jgi:predicted RNA-binding protein with PUA domain
MSINIIVKSWGKEIVINPMGERRVRLYWNSTKQIVTIDFSINNDKEWIVFKKKQEKYGIGAIKVSCDETKLNELITYFSK